MTAGPSGDAAWTYARAGVDRGPTAEALSGLLSAVRYRAPGSSGRPVRAVGHYAGLVRIGRETLAVTTDTVGTKVLLAASRDRWEEVGTDLVAVNVNDLASVGARPIGLVDTLLCDRVDAARFARIGTGIDRGLRESRCSLLGGETAVVPDVVRGMDLGGTAIGYFPGRRPVLGRSIRPGDRLLGFPSSGLHANGFTLVRKLIEARGVDLDTRRPGAAIALGEELLAPTRIYVGLTEALAGVAGVTGLAHVSGGGVRNLVRLRADVRFELDGWPRPEGLFGWLMELGPVAPTEMYQTFNMGIGFVVVARPTALPAIRRRLARTPFASHAEVGRVLRGRGVALPGLHLEYDGYA
jgi:phosphoribosylformylglycinamidine cyclo-ligase